MGGTRKWRVDIGTKQSSCEVGFCVSDKRQIAKIGLKIVSCFSSTPFFHVKTLVIEKYLKRNKMFM